MTGTYTVEEEKEAKQSKHKTEKARMDLESLVGVQEYRAHYVEDWAARHATAPPGSTGSGSDLKKKNIFIRENWFADFCQYLNTTDKISGQIRYISILTLPEIKEIY